MPFIDKNTTQSWIYSNTLSGVNRAIGPNGLQFIDNVSSSGFQYKQNKNYQFITTIFGSGPIGSTISVKYSSPFNDSIVASTINGSIQSDNGVNFFSYAQPIRTDVSTNVVRYGANETFTNSAITNSKMIELEFLVNGYREFVYLDDNVTVENQPSGWVYNSDNFSYDWHLSNPSTSKSPTFSKFGSGLNSIFERNFLAKIVDYDSFNLDINFIKSGGTYSNGLDIFIVETSKLSNLNEWIKIDSLTASTSYSKLGILGTNEDGTKNYLVMSASQSADLNSSLLLSLSNINIYGSYNTNNNRQYLTTNSGVFENPTNLALNINNATYSFSKLVNGLTFSITGKIGNGSFRSGVWENGVWNNGWRDDKNIKDFNDISYSLLTKSDTSWRVQITGTTQSVVEFNIGDKVSIGNIIAIDINNNRKLLKDFYSITGKGDNWLEVDINTVFPYRRIEKDSPNHKIKITKNIWLSGAFFNGYFTGVWNGGLFKGFPLITEMFNTHWIDGTFNGGRFNSTYPSFIFTSTSPTDNCVNENLTIIFGQGHNLVTGDYIIISKDDKSINPNYDGVAKVLKVDGNNVIVNKRYTGFKKVNTQGVLIPETGKVTRYTATGLMQNLKFNDNNRSRIKSSDSKITSSVFSFNSWIDTNYDNSRAVTLGRDFRSFESLSGKSISRNNLYGYPTYDILSSVSRFRNSFDINSSVYKLGTKYKVFTDFIGNASEFNEPFSEIDYTNFINAGWTYSFVTPSDVNVKRTESIISINDELATQYINSGVTGDEMYVYATSSGVIFNNNNVSISKSRYTVTEFDVITHSITKENYSYKNIDIDGIENTEPIVEFPVLHLSNLNYEVNTIKVNNNNVQVYKNMSFLPISKNINHLLTTNSFRLDSIENTSPERWGGFRGNQKTKKYEYFYNKTDLMLNISGGGLTGSNSTEVVLDNLKIYEVDMIPFFKYFTDTNIYKGIQIPNQGLSPEIDFSDSDFEFIDNISVTLDSIDINIVDETKTCVEVIIDTVGTGVTTTSPITVTPSITINSIDESGTIEVYSVSFTIVGNYLELSATITRNDSSSATQILNGVTSPQDIYYGGSTGELILVSIQGLDTNSGLLVVSNTFNFIIP